jgi:predicted metal-binding protein
MSKKAMSDPQARLALMKRTKDLAPYIKMACQRGVDDAVVVETSRVVTAPWVRMKCEFGCSGFGLSLCCPPRTPTPDEMRKILDSYSHGILLHQQIKKGNKVVGRLSETAVDLEQALFLDGCYKAWTLGSGPCGRCKSCTMEACVHADRARPSMEACGIDVFATARAYKLPIQVVKGPADERNFYALVLVE